MNGRSSCVAPEVVYSGGGAGQAYYIMPMNSLNMRIMRSP